MRSSRMFNSLSAAVAAGVAVVVLASSSITGVQSHMLGPDVRVEDMWCFDPLFIVGTPNIFGKVMSCLVDKQQADCDTAYNNFCAGFGIDPVQCQAVYDQAYGSDTSTVRCKDRLTIALNKMLEQFGTCTSTPSYGLWKSYITTDDVTTQRRLLVGNPYSSCGCTHSTAVTWVHKAWDALAGVPDGLFTCTDVTNAFVKASHLAAKANLQVNSVNVDGVHGKQFKDLLRTHEGDAVANHGGIEYVFVPNEFWSMFNSFSLNRMPPGWTCDWIKGLDGCFHKRCFRAPDTHVC